MITSGQLLPGQRVPSDNELAAAFHVSRLTAHRALRELAQEGIVQRVHGVGTFVSAPRDTSSATKIYNIANEVRSAGRSFQSIVIQLAAVKASALIGTQLAIAPGEPVFFSSIVYHADGLPAQLEDRFVLPAFSPHYLEQDFTRGSTTDYLQSIAPADQAEQVIEAIMPDAESRRLLKITSREPCLLVIRTTWVAGQITTYTRFTHPGSRRRLVTRISGSAAGRTHEGGLDGRAESY